MGVLSIHPANNFMRYKNGLEVKLGDVLRIVCTCCLSVNRIGKLVKITGIQSNQIVVNNDILPHPLFLFKYVKRGKAQKKIWHGLTQKDK